MYLDPMLGNSRLIATNINRCCRGGNVFRLFVLCSCFLSACVSSPAPQERLGQETPQFDVFYQPQRQEAPSIDINDLLSINDIGEKHQDGGLSVSPQGDLVAFQVRTADLTKNSYNLSWYIASTHVDRDPIFVSDGGDPILVGELLTGRTSGAIEVNTAKWSPDGRFIAFRKKFNGAVQIWRASVDGSGAKQLTRNESDVTGFEWSKDGTQIIFEVTGYSREDHTAALKQESREGYLFDDRFMPTESNRPILRTSLTAALAAGRNADRPKNTFVYDFTLNKEKRYDVTIDENVTHLEDDLRDKLTGGLNRRVSLVSKTNNLTSWAENTDPELFAGPSAPVRVMKLDQSGKEQSCLAQECYGFITDIWVGVDSSVFFRRREGANYTETALYAWEGNESVRVVVKNDDWFGDCELSGDGLICFYEEWTRPRRIVRIDLETGHTQTLVQLNPRFNILTFSEIEKLEWRGDDGSEAVGHFVYPLNYDPTQRYPLIIVQYRSFGFLRGGVGDEYPIHVLAANGFAVLSIDRPVDWVGRQQESEMRTRLRRQWEDGLWERRSAMDALEFFVNQLAQREIIDSKRIGITGLSDGSDTAWFALTHSDLFAAASVSSGGLSPFIYYMLPKNFRAVFDDYFGLSSPSEGISELWRQLSPEYHVDKIDAPILIQAADSEFLGAVPAYSALQDGGKPIEMRVFPDEYHVKFQPVHRASIYERNIDWMNFWLRNFEDPDTDKLDQYSRWRGMRNEHCNLHDQRIKPYYCEVAVSKD